MWKWRLIIFLSIFIFCLIAFKAFQNETEKNNFHEQDQSHDSEGGVKQFLFKTHLVKSEASKKLWDLKADKIRKEKSSDEWRLDHVDAKFFGENEVTYRITGRVGFLDNIKKHLKIDGNVKIFSSNGYTLNTFIIYYKERTHKVIGPRSVELWGFSEEKGNSLFVKGDLFEAHLKTNTINLIGNIYGEKKMSDDRFMKIKSHKAVLNSHLKDVLFKDSVIVSVKSLEMTGPRARFKYENDKLHSLFMDGGVKIKDMKRLGQAQEIEIFFRKDKYILRGNPKVIQAEDQVVGEEIIIYDGGNRVRVKKARTKYNTKNKENLNL